MLRIERVEDLRACRRLWEQAFPREYLTDLWEVRDCFHEHYRRPACFVVARDGEQLCGLLPLSWIEETGRYGYFPGETWKGRTWLEQNRILARDAEVLQQLIAHIPGRYQVRYLLPAGVAETDGCVIDEIGYLFHPPRYDFDMESYYREFAHRNVKRLRREVAALAQRLSFRHDHAADFEALVELNLGRFGTASYFADARFTESFRSLAGLLRDRGWLRLTAVLDQRDGGGGRSGRHLRRRVHAARRRHARGVPGRREADQPPPHGARLPRALRPGRLPLRRLLLEDALSPHATPALHARRRAERRATAGRRGSAGRDP